MRQQRSQPSGGGDPAPDPGWGSIVSRVLPEERGKPPPPPPADEGKGSKGYYGKSKDDKGKGYYQPYPSYRYDQYWGWRY